MFIVRPIKESDLAALEKFAFSTTLGMLSLPKDRGLLKKKIEKSLLSFGKEIKTPKDEFYLFVLEDTEKGIVGGSSGIYSKTGVGEPLYCFRLEVLHPKKNGLPLPDEIKILHPAAIMDGPSELCALFVDHSLRKEHFGELLSRSRFLFISQQKERFENTLTARLRGFINKSKLTSPFWEALGKRFLEMEFQEAHSLQLKGSEFISKFLPKHPIYVSLLPKQAQYVIQKTHITTKPALVMLKKEGFQLTDQVDIFEAGPVVSANTSSILSVKDNTLATVGSITQAPMKAIRYIISNASLDFRACYGDVKFAKDKEVEIPEKVASALKINVGDKIRFIKTHEEIKKP